MQINKGTVILVTDTSIVSGYSGAQYKEGEKLTCLHSKLAYHDITRSSAMKPIVLYYYAVFTGEGHGLYTDRRFFLY